jgi:hypothetical protein
LLPVVLVVAHDTMASAASPARIPFTLIFASLPYWTLAEGSPLRGTWRRVFTGHGVASVARGQERPD